MALDTKMRLVTWKIDLNSYEVRERISRQVFYLVCPLHIFCIFVIINFSHVNKMGTGDLVTWISIVKFEYS